MRDIVRILVIVLLLLVSGRPAGAQANDWLEPNARSPDRADSVAWISEVLDEPHTRELLESLLRAV